MAQRQNPSMRSNIMMNTVLACAMVCALPLTALGQQTDAKSGVVTITGDRTKITLPRTPYPIKQSEFADVAGEYVLQNGARPFVYNSGRRMYAQVGNRPEAELVAASSDVLVAKDRTIKMIFDQADNGSVSKVLVTYVVPKETRGSRQVSMK
jgi:hypothetical protein